MGWAYTSATILVDLKNLAMPKTYPPSDAGLRIDSFFANIVLGLLYLTKLYIIKEYVADLIN